MTISARFKRDTIPQSVAREMAKFDQVLAVVWAGSLAQGIIEPKSDFDIYVYLKGQKLPNIEKRKELIKARGVKVMEVDNRFWEPGDEWIEPGGQVVDVMYRGKNWIEDQLDKVLVRHEASLGYSTCFWYNVLHSRVLYDREGWFKELKRKAGVTYPQPLKQAIIAKNYPPLRQTISSYSHQLDKAVARADLVSINHRLNAFLASYFDIVFALNRLPHPGEKKLVSLIKRDCFLIPKYFDLVNKLLSEGFKHQKLVSHLNLLVDGLDEVIPDS